MPTALRACLLILLTASCTVAAAAGLGIAASVAPDGRVWIVGLNAQQQLFAQSSEDQGSHWSAAQILDTRGDRILADGENRPMLAFGPEGRAVITYSSPAAKGPGVNIRLLRSSDGGKRFAPPLTVHNGRQPVGRGYAASAFDRNGVLHTVWMDNRDQLAADSDSVAATRSAIFRNESRDGGASFGPDTPLATNGCECCRIALAPTADGKVAALWGQLFEPNIRDHAFARLGDNNEPERASYDEWPHDACPGQGPALIPEYNGGFHMIWHGERAPMPGGQTQQLAVRYGRLSESGRPRGEYYLIPDDKAEHADVAAKNRTVVIAWLSRSGDLTQLRAWVSNDDGSNFALRDLASSREDHDYPRLLATPKGILLLWRTASGVQAFPFTPRSQG
ncbi:MAG TPA: sialidase family protein [Rhodocyclaceae bacterium]